MPAQFLALGGSRRRDSLTNALLGTACDIARGMGAEVDCVTVSEPGLDLFDPDLTTPSDDGVRRLLDAVTRADTILLASPIYGGTPSGAVKNLLDTLHLAKHETTGPLADRRVGVAAVGGGSLTGSYAFQRAATTTLEIACKNLGAWVDPHHLELSELLFDTEGCLRDALARDALTSLVRRLVGSRIPAPARREASP